MSKWRPTNNSIYVIPDVHGNYNELRLILDRILPLRNNKNSKDLLIMLGDYIDRGPRTPEILDTLISLHKEYRDQVVFLRGNHEEMMLVSTGRIFKYVEPRKPSFFAIWMSNGGGATVSQYAAREGVYIRDATVLTQDRAISFLDSKHVDFLMKETVLYHELDNYVFVHAGCEPTLPMEEQDEEDLLWDTSLFNFVRTQIIKGNPLPWNKTIVCGHSYKGPILKPNYMMLDASSKRKLIAVELNSMECFAAYMDNQRLVKEELKETVPNDFAVKGPVFSRIVNS